MMLFMDNQSRFAFSTTIGELSMCSAVRGLLVTTKQETLATQASLQVGVMASEEGDRGFQ